MEKQSALPMEKRPVEFVERKGLGHPDTLIDGIVESVCRTLCKHYISEFGTIMHHNVDKGQICGGMTSVDYGGGVFLKPIYILLSGRATSEIDGKKIPAIELAIEAAKTYLKENTRYLDVEKDVLFDSKISQGSRDLVDLFLRAPKVPLANDTSFGVGFAPYSETERLVLETERLLNSKEYKAKRPEVGEDIKVMAVREGDVIRLTVACAFVSRHVTDLADYIEKKKHVEADVRVHAKKITRREVEVFINTADDYKRNSTYITLTGLSCEMGDDGSVGRGNRVSGLITPGRPMSLEATAGKNPVNHVGKIYNVLAHRMAQDVVQLYPQIEECTITILSQIGKPIDQPKATSVALLMKKGERIEKIRSKVKEVIDGWLEDAPTVTEMIINGEVTLF